MLSILIMMEAVMNSFKEGTRDHGRNPRGMHHQNLSRPVIKAVITLSCLVYGVITVMIT